MQSKATEHASVALTFFALQDRGRGPGRGESPDFATHLVRGSSSPQRGAIFIENGPPISPFLILRRPNVTTCLQNDWCRRRRIKKQNSFERLLYKGFTSTR